VIKEKRKDKRIEFKNYVNLISKGEVFKVESIDLSREGLFLNTALFNVGDELSAIFSIILNIPFKRNGVVVRKDIKGIGIHFLK